HNSKYLGPGISNWRFFPSNSQYEAPIGFLKAKNMAVNGLEYTCRRSTQMVRSKIIVVSEDPNMVHQTRQFAESHGWQCEVHSPQDWQRLQSGNSSTGVPSLAFGSATVGEGGKVLQFPQPSSVLNPNAGTSDASVETINDLEAKA